MSGTKSSRRRPTPYHHGDLRQALLDSAIAILTETGRWDFSLREVARRAGVSHNAPYRHFPDKEALLAAIGVAGFAALNARETGIKSTSSAPVRLEALGRSYIAFGVAHPALYRLMFGSGLPKPAGLPPPLLGAIEAARARLRGVILDGARAGAFAIDPEDADEVTVAALASWSLVHGFTLLTIDSVLERGIHPDAIQNLSSRVVRRLITGLASLEGRAGLRNALT